MLLPPLSTGLQRGFASLVASGVAECATLPIDKAKVMQQNSAADELTLFGCISSTVEQDGVGACWAGLNAALLRQCSYSALSLALYAITFAGTLTCCIDSKCRRVLCQPCLQALSLALEVTTSAGTRLRVGRHVERRFVDAAAGPPPGVKLGTLGNLS